MQSHTSQTPTLAPPGAGLPVPELWIARTLFAFNRWIYRREAANRRFLLEQKKIANLIARCSSAVACEPVLIPRLRGLEDSSRYWSVSMTLDHLRITNAAFAHIIQLLAQGSLPPGVASTAAVKPSPTVTLEVVQAYEQTCAQVLTAVADHPNLNTPFKFAHPWFGPMNAEGWHLLAGVHMGIHRKQIEVILESLIPGSSR